MKGDKNTRARGLRRTQTKAEAKLWSAIRAGQLCGLKFRRQHPVDVYFLDFACLAIKLCVELDGDSHDTKGQQDLARETRLRILGWNIVRFDNADVFSDLDGVLRGIAKAANKPYIFQKRIGRGDGAAKFFRPGQD